MDDVEILEIEEEKTNVLIEQAETRKKLLKLANEAMDLQKINIDSYTNSTYQLNKMKEAYIQLRKKNQELEKEFKVVREQQTKIENELIRLRLQNEHNKKKRSALQSLLQVVLNVYGEQEITHILGISYSKLKEYLED
jgi:hypothetical protein